MQVKSPDSKPVPRGWVLRGIQWILIVFGLSVLTAVFLRQALVSPHCWDRLAVWSLGLGFGLLGLGILLDRFPSSLSLFLGSTLVSCLLGTVLLVSLGIDPFETIDRALLALFPPRVGIWRFDPIFGYSHRPGAVGHFDKGEIHVTYHIDAEGCRVTPTPENPRGTILFLGGSFTFGTGVEDHEPYPFLLGKDDWKDYKIRNRAVTGWGTQHAYLALVDEFETHPIPRLVFYGWISAHRERNYIRKSWVAHIGRPWGLTQNLFGVRDFRKHPHFELADGQLVFQGVVGPGEVREDPPDLREREIRLTVRLIEEMNGLCRERGVPFYLLDLPIAKGANPLDAQGRLNPPSYLIEAVREFGIRYLDLTGAYRGSLPGDNHPNPATHRAIADALASDESIREILYPESEIVSSPEP